MELEELQYCEKIRQWLADRYGSGADAIWQKTAQTYVSWLADAPDYGGKKNGHANATSVTRGNGSVSFDRPVFCVRDKNENKGENEKR